MIRKSEPNPWKGRGWELVFDEDGKSPRVSATDPELFGTGEEALGHVIRRSFAGSLRHREAIALIGTAGAPEQRERVEDLLTGMVEYRREESRRFRADGVRDRVRDMLAADPGLRGALDASWSRIHAAIEERALSLQKKARPSGYEVHHQMEVARECFFIDLIEGRDAADAEAHVRLRISLDADPERFIREWRAGARSEPDDEPVPGL